MRAGLRQRPLLSSGWIEEHRPYAANNVSRRRTDQRSSNAGPDLRRSARKSGRKANWARHVRRGERAGRIPEPSGRGGPITELRLRCSRKHCAGECGDTERHCQSRSHCLLHFLVRLTGRDKSETVAMARFPATAEAKFLSAGLNDKARRNTASGGPRLPPAKSHRCRRPVLTADLI